MAHSTEDRQLNGKAKEPTLTASVAAEDQAQMDGSSDGEGEKAARERLKKTSIAGLAEKSVETPPSSETHPLAQSTIPESETQAEGGNGIRGRPAKKRSFEDLTRGDSTMEDSTEPPEPPLPKSGHHKRMRSRDIASGEHITGKYEADAASSVREESDTEAQKTPGGPGIFVDAPLNDDSQKQENKGEITTTADDLDQLSQQSQLNPTSGFANTSSTSPFGAFSQAKSESNAEVGTGGSKDKSTSPTAFASSGLSAFASSEKSPFSSIGAKSPSGFAAGSSSGTFGPSTSGGFGSTATTSPFKTATGFGSSGGFGLATGFGSATTFGTAKSFGGGLSSFAGPSGGSGTFGTSKPIGATKDIDDDGSNNEEDDDEEKHEEDFKQDERFHEQDVETGEEEEETIFTCRAKLYHFEKEWKERGVGTIKINLRYVEKSLATKSDSSLDEKDDDTDKDEDARDFSGDDLEAGEDSFLRTERKARLLMRTDGVHRVILNTPVFKDMHIGQQDGSEPVGKTMHLTGLEDGKPKAFQIKIGKEEVLRDLYWKVVELRTDAS